MPMQTCGVEGVGVLAGTTSYPSFASRSGSVKETNDEIEPTGPEDSAKQEDASMGPKRKLLRRPATRAGKVVFAIVVAALIVGGAYAVVVLGLQLPTQTGPGIPVTRVSVGCTDLIVTPVSILVGDGGGDVKLSCGNGNPALTTVNGTASLAITGLGSEWDDPFPPGTYSPALYLIPYAYPGPIGSGNVCHTIPGEWGGIDERHFGYPITIGTGRWDYCLEYPNQTSAGSMNMVTITWTAIDDWD